jgi:hypothetical protein
VFSRKCGEEKGLYCPSKCVLSRPMGCVGHFQVSVLESSILSFPNTPKISLIIPPIVTHPSTPNTLNSTTHILQQPLSFFFILLRCCGKEFRSDDIEPEGGLDSDHEPKAGVDGVASGRARSTNLLEEAEGWKA